MKNKVRLKKTIFILVICICLSMILFGAIQIYQYKSYTRNFNDKIESIMQYVLEEYDNVSKSDLMKLLNDTEKTHQFVKEYGIDDQNESIILENDQSFRTYLYSNCICIGILGCVFIFIFLIYNHKKDKEINEIREYLEEINHGNYKLDIQDNTEEEISILKNELYKITVMLKEQADNLKNEKANLKKSIEDISHQLKTPLTSILILLDNILDNPDMLIETRNEFIMDAKRKILSMNILVQNLLKLSKSKFDADIVVFHNDYVDIFDLLEKSKNQVSVLSDLKNVEIKIHKSNHVNVFCDDMWQIEAISNILKNAIEYSYENNKIDVWVEYNTMYTKIIIRDYGKGINRKDQRHIFDRFYKGNNPSKDSVGIGLSLSKAIIEKNNGHIQVNSDGDHGTEFTITYLNLKTFTYLAKGD